MASIVFLMINNNCTERIMIKLIISALEGSEHSLTAFKYVRKIAEKYDAKLILLHAYHPISDLRGTIGFDRLPAKPKQAGNAIIKNGRRRLEQDSLQIEEDLLEGPAADTILSVAKLRDADLVVVGISGLGSFKCFLFGSVRKRVSRYASCPMLVVR
jgi:nucleotide-binding universal stress UspA family protein